MWWNDSQPQLLYSCVVYVTFIFFVYAFTPTPLVYYVGRRVSSNRQDMPNDVSELTLSDRHLWSEEEIASVAG